MSDLQKSNRLRDLQEEVVREKGLSPETLRRLLAKVDEYSESHRAFGLPDDLINILKHELDGDPEPARSNTATEKPSARTAFESAEGSPSPPPGSPLPSDGRGVRGEGNG